eukprot:CAMPEP_0169191468 /NCGR_PEP_ID=MMETSP1016-20121227/5091_1 /TAXON_ID=342587 /ORGANISM="Karlodinium micrum, Strain CCMP2283" /LENGTH=135 /DNA_ID=CAMNT_0009267731 /DNA_START=210 /DNA_END=614 /DNA_ORIENTATION=-
MLKVFLHTGSLSTMMTATAPESSAFLVITSKEALPLIATTILPTASSHCSRPLALFASKSTNAAEHKMPSLTKFECQSPEIASIGWWPSISIKSTSPPNSAGSLNLRNLCILLGKIDVQRSDTVDTSCPRGGGAT